mgnify:CR=1 FL=1
MVYGVSTILGRLLNFALIPVFTHLLDETKDMGYVNSLYGYVALLNVLCAMGMETTFFFYANKANEKKAFDSAFTVILTSSGLISLAVFFGAVGLDLFQQTGNPWYYRIIAGMLLFDALAILPFARMRNQGKSKRFAILKMLWIVINVLFNFIFFFGYTYLGDHSTFSVLFDPSQKVLYIFISNLIASFIILLLVLKEFKDTSILVAGHTDSVGNDSYNQGLSERRAYSVKNFLSQGGVASGRVQAVGFGERHPIADNSSASGREANRRVELELEPLR